jgi:uncharacterized DUF497 family protein
MFSWDERKALRNFADPDGLDWEDLEHELDEPRWKRLALSAEGRILLVVYTLRRLKNDAETIRIISARQASRKERRAYAGQPN